MHYLITTESTVYTVSSFIQHRMEFGKLQFIYGLRMDAYSATVGERLQKIEAHILKHFSIVYSPPPIVFNLPEGQILNEARRPQE